jgi:hypothetical protein
LYQLMSGLMPSIGKGTHAFRPSNQTQGASSAISTMPPEPIFSEDETNANTQTSVVQPPAIHPGPSSLNHVTQSETHDPPPPSSPPPSAHTMSLEPSVSSISAKRKFSALEASLSGTPSVVSAGKKQRSVIPGAVALNGIKESLDMFNKTIERGLVVQPHERVRDRDTSPERRQKAMACLQEKETHLDDERLIALIDLFKSDTAEADTYLSLQRETLRKKWLQKQLVERCGFPADVDMP